MDFDLSRDNLELDMPVNTRLHYLCPIDLRPPRGIGILNEAMSDASAFGRTLRTLQPRIEDPRLI
jgi:hypothetical protein